MSQRTVLITGCSDNSLGAALAHAFHAQGLRVFATARDLSKSSSLKAAGIECLELDVLSTDSITSCVSKVSELTGGTLDILINNAGRGHYMPFLHLDLKKARDLFELNVWSYLEVTQAFLPLLMKGASPDGNKSLLVNNTSISSVLRTPYHSAYSASKAAMAMFNDTQRIELRPFGVRVIDLKTGSTESNFGEHRSNELDLPDDSPYKPIEAEVKNVITGAATEAYAEDQTKWAENVVNDLLKDNPPDQIWRGGAAGRIQITNGVPIPDNVGDPAFMNLGGLDKLEKMLTEKAKNS
ncbi:hypothetical protein H2198_002827 [Neophaeococcomyces mojaviensis]|uniref:Uncharacterized protein n=1 Tax=Neophaeococcomyces mojaviensis TaxID=3383035 RepID=A0ACC3ADW3_9EURO|nr:hypothetical protein H2198_002827 [Knufia sp. JES_112]